MNRNVEKPTKSKGNVARNMSGGCSKSEAVEHLSTAEREKSKLKA
jgi:hypothetical protein